MTRMKNRPKLDLKERQEIWLNNIKWSVAKIDSSQSHQSKVILNEAKKSKFRRSRGKFWELFVIL